MLTLIAGIGLSSLLLMNKPMPPGDDYETPATKVRVIIAKQRSEHLIVRSQGTVQPRTESQLIPEVSGRVVWMSPALVSGGNFSQGDILLRIDDADYRNAADKSRSALDRAAVELEHAEDELERLQKLIGQNLASQSQVDEAQRRFRVAQANVSEAKITLQQAQRDLTRTELTAPYRGFVRNEKVDLGQFVSRGSNIATIYAEDFVEVRLPIASKQLTYLDIAITGQLPLDPPAPVSIIGELGNVQFIWEGELVRTEREFDSRSRMFYGVARIENAPHEDMPPLAPGLFVQAEIQGRLFENIVRLPRSAMRDENQVAIVDSDNRLRFRRVTPLRIEHDEVLISNGLNDGDRVSISPSQTVVEGMKVEAVKS